MGTGPWPFRLLGLIAMLATVGGCAATTVRTLDAELARPHTGLREEAGLPIEGYRLQDKGERDYKGWVRLAGADSLAFWSEQTTMVADDFGSGTKMRVTGPVLLASTVASFRVVQPESTRLVAGLAAGVALVVLAVNGWNESWKD